MSLHGSPHRLTKFQSTPPRGGRRQHVIPHRSCHGVSIHAPARGATLSTSSSSMTTSSFNPRPRAGGDTGYLHLLPILSRFNPRPRAGGDIRTHELRLCPERFQSTPPRGGRRRHLLHAFHDLACFNPRPRAGGDKPNVRS